MIRISGFGDLVIRRLGIKKDKTSPIPQSPDIQIPIPRLPNNQRLTYLHLKKGFTLIEYVMVIVVIGILAALAIPRFNTFYSLKLNGAVKKVVSDIKYVQQLAVSRHTNTRLVFNSAAETYAAWEEFPRGSGVFINITDPFTRAPLAVNFAADPQYGGINIFSANFGGTPPSPILRFNWRGTPQNGAGTDLSADGSLELRYQGNTLIIYVTPQTGRVRAE